MKTFSKILLFSAIIQMIVFSSCHKSGCTNKDAINFDVTADEDDGSCVVCQSAETKIGEETQNLKDTKFGSPHYNQPVAKFYLNQYVLTPNNKVCGKETCVIKLSVQSLVNENMYINYYRIIDFSGPLNIYYTNEINIEANQTVDVGIINTFNNPPFLNINLDSIQVTLQGEIIYY